MYLKFTLDILGILCKVVTKTTTCKHFGFQNFAPADHQIPASRPLQSIFHFPLNKSLENLY